MKLDRPNWLRRSGSVKGGRSFLKVRGTVHHPPTRLNSSPCKATRHKKPAPTIPVPIVWSAQPGARPQRRRHTSARPMDNGSATTSTIDSRIPAPTATPPGARPQRPTHKYSRPATGSRALAPTTTPPSALPSRRAHTGCSAGRRRGSCATGTHSPWPKPRTWRISLVTSTQFEPSPLELNVTP